MADSSWTSAAAASAATAAPAFDFQPLQKSSVDLFATAPQVKKLTRREKDKMLRELEVKRAKQRAVADSNDAADKGRKGQPRQSDRSAAVAEVVRSATTSSSSGDASDAGNKGERKKGLFETVFDTKEVEQELAAQEDRRNRKRSKKQVLRHALHSNEEEDARTVFVGNLPNTIHKRDVEKIFKSCGSITAVRIRCQALEELDEKHQNLGRAVRVLRGEIKKDAKYSATAYVLFDSAKSIVSALEKNGLVFHNRHLVVTTMDVESRAYPPETSIFLGNVAYNTTEEDVWSFFQEHGIADVKRVRLVRDRETGDCKGFGYVEFMHASSVQPAIETRGDKLNGRELRIVHVNKSKEVKVATKSRREKRRSEHAGGRVSAEERKRSRSGGDADGGSRGSPDYSHVKKPRTESDLPSWAGLTTNPRRKMPKDLRPLVEGKVEFKPRGPRAPVKRKKRNPEK
ncbi:DRBD9 / Double RNA binding domain protein 9 / NOP12 [Leishmania donovani]|uniref:Double_RNA_binding_domain_protein_9/GeneDB:LmjF.3 5.2550 n=1 Tax=Leishmania donovani TaxID=5661 RepID=A0A504XG56_LEIDO|nr:RNA recognition motif family protein [Leishmania donovani]CAJ1993067.1 DRBD9 / Double RNA binding domain protein 9 / NOP12 [Leishmania donovani]VDZ48895.1 Double_RNA_binding_domain_protein_9/GeneDB:LmjF.35.2550 [Leishmania donovani]